MNEIELLNEWLEQKAVKFDQDSDPRMKFWSSYYRGLKNLSTKDSFLISSGDSFAHSYRGKTPLGTYLETHCDEYDRFPMTGSCTYIKKK